MKAVHLRSEYLNKPVGLGNVPPCFSWHCEDGIRQTAYRVLAVREEKTVWDSGKVASSAMNQIQYAGEPLHSRDRIEWSVQLWDEEGHAGEKAESFFEIGLLEAGDWKAKWISGNYKPCKRSRYPADCFRKAFEIKQKIVQARLYATARGLYDVTLNGIRLESFILAPGMTDYRKRIQVQTYDVTSLLRQGQNIWGLQLADGWYRGSVAAYGVTNVYGTQTSLLAQMEIILSDGSRQTIVTDSSWQWSNDGPLRFADLKDGEQYDARNVPSYAGHAVEVASPQNARLCASDNVPVLEQEHFAAKPLKNGVFDFGQNIAGYLSFSVQGRNGQKFRLICGEVLDEAGNVDLHGIQETRPAKGWSQLALIRKLMTGKVKGCAAKTPLQEIEFTCSGQRDDYKTSFAVFGFRYAQIVGDDVPQLENLTAIAVYSDMEQTGDFICSNGEINQLVKNTRWSMKGNHLDVPTDCPTRERLGWTGDAQIFFHTGAYLMNTASFFRKWLRDMQDAAYPNGLLPAVLPFSGVEMMYKNTGISVGWADAIYLIPWRHYLRYNDMEALRQAWPMIHRYAEYLMMHTGQKSKKESAKNPYNSYTYEKGVHLGEWLEPEEFRDKVYGARARHPEECTAYLYLAMTTIQKIAEVLGETKELSKYRQYAEGAKKAYYALFVDSGALNTERQAKLVRPIALGVLDGEKKREAEQRLQQAVEAYGYRVGTGFLSTPFLLSALSDAGMTEDAYRLLENTQQPGWLAEVEAGATTIWENWNGEGSRNHYSPGSVCQWLFDTVAGIRVIAERKFLLQPLPGGSLTWAEASYVSPYGLVFSKWTKSDGAIRFEFTVPANTEAHIRLPDGTNTTVAAGHHTFEIAG